MVQVADLIRAAELGLVRSDEFRNIMKDIGWELTAEPEAVPFPEGLWTEAMWTFAEQEQCKWVTIDGRKVCIKPRKIPYTVEPRLKEPKRLRNMLTKATEELPEEDVDGVKGISVVREIEPPEKVGDETWVTTGAYNERTKKIRIVEPVFDSEEHLKENLYHEVGHHVWRKLPREKRHDWFRVYEDNVDKLPTVYAKESPYDGFAECYAFWRMDRSFYKAFSDFLRNELVGGKKK